MSRIAEDMFGNLSADEKVLNLQRDYTCTEKD